MAAHADTRSCVRDSVRLYDGVVANPPEALGARVRALREAMDLSLRDLAERSGVSAPMLSQVERGETSPTLQVARRIAAGLELRLSQLLRLDEDGAVSVVRGDERRKGPGRVHGHTYEILTPPLPGQRAELSRHTLSRGAVTGGPATRRCTSPAAARPRWSSRARSCWSATASEPSSPPATASHSTPTFRTISKTLDRRRPCCSRS